jgi:hypothetical protein
MTDPAKTVSLALTPITAGSTPPNIQTDAFAAAIASAQQGGDATQAYFDSMNQTADYWGWVADNVSQGNEVWIDAVGPDGTSPIKMSSDGNLDVRMGAFYRDPPSGEGHVAAAPGDPIPVVGIATIQTHNRTSGLAATLSLGLGLAGLPVGIKLSSMLFQDLLKPVYANLKTYFNKNAVDTKAASEVEDPDIDPEEASEDALADADAEIGDIAGDLGEQGAKFLAVQWGSVAAETAGLAALAAIPMIVGYLGHKMVVSVMIHNLSDTTGFTWSILDQHWGTSSVLPNPKTNNTIPKMDYITDSFGDRSTVKVSYEASMQFINSTNLGDIGVMLTLTPSDGGPAVATGFYVPWAGHNIIWTGASTGNAEQMWDDHLQVPDDKLSVINTVGAIRSTISITKLSGETDDAYFYGVVITLENAS